MALNSGRAVPQPLANGGFAPRPGLIGNPAYNLSLAPTIAPAPTFASLPLAPTYAQGPAFGGTPAPAIGGQATAPVLTSDGTYASNVGADGTYWEKVSGMTAFGNTIATQVICKRKLPTQTVNPVVNVPYPVPTAVPTCGPLPHNAHLGHNIGYGAPQGRWTY